MNPTKTSFIELALEREALRFGEFTLKSGRQSPYFFNAGRFSSGRDLAILGRCYADTLIEQAAEFDLIFGPAYKGIPLAAATASALFEHHHRNTNFCFNRKEAKKHGEGGNLVGAELSGRVLIVDDVITAGTAIRESIDIIQAAGATPAGVLVAMDRQEKGRSELSAIQEVERDYDLPVYAIINLGDLLQYIERQPEFAEHVASMREYREQYGIQQI